MTDLATVPTFWARVRALVFATPADVEDVPTAMGVLEGAPVTPPYDPENAMSAAQSFPFVRACLQDIAEDIAGLPIKVFVGPKDDPEELDDHPVLDLLANPNNQDTGEQLQQQRVWDWLLTGNGLRLEVGDGDPLALLRLHPAEWSAVMSGNGLEVAGWRCLSKPGTIYEAERVRWDRMPSWRTGADQVLGAGFIEALHHSLTTDINSAKMAAKSAANGRPFGIVSPPDETGTKSVSAWGVPFIKAIRARIEQRLRVGSGILVLGKSVKYQDVGWSPRDMEFGEQRALTRHEIGAVFNVPPTRLGLQAANYATAQQEARYYWEGIRAKTRQLDAQDTRLARRFEEYNRKAGIDTRTLRVVRDLSEVEALQESRTERLERVVIHQALGVPVADAYALEGFDPPAVLDDETEETEEVEPAEAEEEARALATGTDGAAIFTPRIVGGSDHDRSTPAPWDDVGVWTSPSEWARSIAERTITPGKTAESRDAYWKDWAETVHGPAEKALQRAMTRLLTQQGNAIAKRAGDVLGQRLAPDGYVVRNISADELAKILDSVSTKSAWERRLKRYIRQIVDGGFRNAARLMGLDLTFDPARRNDIVNRELGSLIVNVDSTTTAWIRDLINEGIENGDSVNDIQAKIRQHRAFKPSRALTIARTETTRDLAAGSYEAYGLALPDAPGLRLQWITARFAVRPSHDGMDGQIRDIGEPFVSDAGATALHPGGFNVAGEDINCRCDIAPYFEGED